MLTVCLFAIRVEQVYVLCKRLNYELKDAKMLCVLTGEYASYDDYDCKQCFWH